MQCAKMPDMAEKLDLIPASEWGFFTPPQPLVIAGPCAAESESQVMETARELAAIGIHAMRAGIWKPRTHPGSFEGVGEQGLQWLLNARREFGLHVGTEVARKEHVDACLRYGIDWVWIGARTAANPFMVQEIADALRGTDLPVLVKNPVNPDIELWIGALERLNRAGIRKLGAVLRGFSTIHQTPYRNDPGWQIAIELRARFPELPFFADPSHMGGDRKFILGLSQRAMDLGLDGLMIESHHCPAEALSDARQQLTPAELQEMLAHQLNVRASDSQESDYRANIDMLRARIDIIDESLLSLLKARMEISETIGHFKKEHNIIILQLPRWEALMDNLIRIGNTDGLDERFVQALFNVIHQESIRIQNEVLSAKE